VGVGVGEVNIEFVSQVLHTHPRQRCQLSGRLVLQKVQ
jgi:hypothetical protein